jgi:hypothetical protein
VDGLILKFVQNQPVYRYLVLLVVALIHAPQEKTGYVINDSTFKVSIDNIYVTTVANLAEKIHLASLVPL